MNRGAVYADGRLYFNTLDDQTIALDAEDGQASCGATRSGDINKGETMTMAPLVVKDKVLVGNSGGEFGVRGWLDGARRRHGQVAWRAYSTGPDNDVLIGAALQAILRRGSRQGPRRDDLARRSVEDRRRHRVGWISYDPALDLIYYGTANPGPWNPDAASRRQQVDVRHLRARSGNRTGALGLSDESARPARLRRRQREHSHRRRHRRQTRKVLVHPDRNGYVYVIDRATGEVLSASRTCRSRRRRASTSKTGRSSTHRTRSRRPGRVVRDICPASPGGKDWQPAAYSPRTHLVYIPHQNLCEDAEAVAGELHRRHAVRRRDVKMYAGSGRQSRRVHRVGSRCRRKPRGRMKEDLPGVERRAGDRGDVVFYGTMEGWFKAVDAQSGRVAVAIQDRLGDRRTTGDLSRARRQAIHRRAVGRRRLGGRRRCRRSRPARRDGGRRLRQPLPDLQQKTQKGGTLYVFGLP